MKKILVPTDFSDIALNALDYSVELALKSNAELILFHVFEQPIFLHETILTIESAEEIEQLSWKNLEQLQSNILSEHPQLRVRINYTFGRVIDEINREAEKERVDLIVVGAQGAGFLQERLLGSTASSLIRHAAVSVMVIDQHIKFKPAKNILLASDFNETKNQSSLKFLKEFVLLFKAHLCILNVYRESNVIPTVGEIVASLELEKALKHTYHTFFYSKDDEVIEGVNAFIKKQKMDMVVMISRKHSFIERIFHEPYTQKMAFHSHVPFLVLHE